MPDKMRPVILALMETGRIEEARRLLAQEDAIWTAQKDELGGRVVFHLLSENVACACGECGVPSPDQFIHQMLLEANGVSTSVSGDDEQRGNPASVEEGKLSKEDEERGNQFSVEEGKLSDEDEQQGNPASVEEGKLSKEDEQRGNQFSVEEGKLSEEDEERGNPFSVDEGKLSEEDQQRLEKFREILAMVEAGEIQGVPSNEEAIRQLRKDIAALEAGTSTLTGQPEALTLGQPFPGGTIPEGTIGLYPDAIPFLLVLGVGSPVPEDFEAFHTMDGWIEFALVPMGKLLVTMIRWPPATRGKGHGWGLWCDTPWAHRDDSWFDLGELEVEGEDPAHTRYGVSCCMVDSRTNLVAGMRFFTLSPHYSRLYHQELAARLSAPSITPEEFISLSMSYQTRYPNPKMMLDRAIARCKAGLLGK